MCIETVIRSGDYAGNKLKINEDGYAYTVSTSDINERPFLKLFSNPTGSNMAVNAAIGGTPTNIWDGIGAADTGTLDFTFTSNGISIENAAAMHTGTNGLDNTLAPGDKLIFTGSTDMTASAQLSFWIQPTIGYIPGPLLEIELRYLGNRYGNKLDATLYMVDELIGTWKLISIPLIDFGVPIGLVDEIKIKAKNFQKNFYMDELQHGVLGGGAAVDPIYTLKPTSQEEIRLNSLNMHITSTTAATTWGQSWDTINFANVATLPAGVIFEINKFNITTQRIEVTSIIFTNTLSIMSFSASHDETIGGLFSSINFFIPTMDILLNGARSEFMRIIIRDNLSALVAYTCLGRGTVRTISHD